jgi:hypothetical protein
MLTELRTRRTAGFNYDALPPDVAEMAKEAAKNIKETVKKASIEIGNELRRVKESLNHGQFTAWVEVEFGMSIRTAQRCMRIAEYTAKNDKLALLRANALQVLAASTTPDAARDEVVRQLDAGKSLRTRDVLGIIREARENQSKPRVVQETRNSRRAVARISADLPITITKKIRELIQKGLKPADAEYFWARIHRRADRLVVGRLKAAKGSRSNSA